MAAYLIVDTKITDDEAYETFKLGAKPIVESSGGGYLVRSGNTTAPGNELWNPTRPASFIFHRVKMQKRFLTPMNTPR